MKLLRTGLVVLSIAGSLLIANGCKKGSDAPVSTTCATDSDCVYHCLNRGACCPHYCGCNIVKHRDEAAAIEKYNQENCTDKQRKECPTVGGCAPESEKPTVIARCKAGACVAEPKPKSDAAPN